jgi:twitching motility protein PilT
MLDLREAFALVVRSEGSDLHLKVGSRPLVRVHGRLAPVEQYDPLRAEDTERLAREMLADQPRKLDEFEASGEVDLSYAIEGLARFRVNAFRQRGTISTRSSFAPSPSSGCPR